MDIDRIARELGSLTTERAEKQRIKSEILDSILNRISITKID